jgi:hypothetical protein
MTAVAASYGADQLGDPSALTDGFSSAFLGAGLIALAGAVIAALTLRTPQPEGSVPGSKSAADGA